MTAKTTYDDAEQVRHPSMWRLALCVHADRLDMAMTSIVEDNSLIWRSIVFDPAMTPLRALEDAVYDNPVLLGDFSRINILYDTEHTLVIPAERLQADPDSAEDMLASLYPNDSITTVVTPVPGNACVACAPDSDVAAFMDRTFARAECAHRLVPLIKYFGLNNRTGSHGRMHIHLHGEQTDIVIFDQNKLLMANTFHTPQTSDTLYFVLAAAQLLGFDDESDRLMVSGDTDRREALMTDLRRYIPHAMPAIFPSAMFSMGHDAMDAPFELLTLPLCE